jgi:hypothetical protein
MRGRLADHGPSSLEQLLERQHRGTAGMAPASQDASSDVDAFVGTPLAELATLEMGGTRPTSGPKPTPAGAAQSHPGDPAPLLLRHAVTRSGSCATIRSSRRSAIFPAEPGVRRRWLDRLQRTWRLACGGAGAPTAAVMALSTWHRRPRPDAGGNSCWCLLLSFKDRLRDRTSQDQVSWSWIRSEIMV